MSKQTRVRLFLVLVLLGALTGVLATPASQNAYAAPCCSTCDYRFSACIQGLLYPECGGDIWCCDQKTDSCYRFCSFSC